MDKKIAIFDLDGTLIDAYASITKTYNHALSRLGYPSVSVQMMRESVGGGEMDLAGRFVREEDTMALISLYRENIESFLDDNVKLLGGSKELLDFLKENKFKLGVATNRTELAALAILERLKMKEYFDIICTIDDVENPKPHPEMLFKIMDFFGVSDKERIFFVGDMDIDYFTGKNAGIITYIVTTGSSHKKDLERLKNINLFSGLVSLKEYLSEKIKSF